MGWFKRAVKRNTKWAKNKKKKLKKMKLKDVLDNKVVQAGLTAISGGSLAPALAGYNALSNKADDVKGFFDDAGDKLSSVIPDELKSIKGSDIVKKAIANKLTGDDVTMTDIMLEEVADATGKMIVPASTARGGTIYISSKSTSNVGQKSSNSFNAFGGKTTGNSKQGTGAKS